MEYFALALNSLVIRGEAISNTEKRRLLRTRLAIASVVTGSKRWCRIGTKKTAINDGFTVTKLPGSLLRLQHHTNIKSLPGQMIL